LGSCRFRNCRHELEPGCAILAAVEDGGIGKQRFDSYEKTKQAILDQQKK
jgi:ribosome biogenesis GTPase